jgi:riboflavin kinase/FMN adenylyltransferase
MQVFRSLQELGNGTPSVVTVGTFDGVHRAHREIIRETVNRARMIEGRSVVITFDPHPKEVLAPGHVQLLSTLDERLSLLQGLQVDACLVVRFSYEFSRQTPREFYQKYVVDGIGAREVIVGYDHRFGRDRQAGIAALVEIGKEFSFSVFAVHQYVAEGMPVSSSAIRNALLAGNIQLANSLLGYHYSLKGAVIRGDGRGKTIGFPTANIEPESARKLVPANGVYLVGVSVGGRQLFGMMNIGVRPTVSEGNTRVIEVHIFDFGEELYGSSVEVSFLRKLRDERKFASLEDLILQLQADREESMRYIAVYKQQR